MTPAVPSQAQRKQQRDVLYGRRLSLLAAAAMGLLSVVLFVERPPSVPASNALLAIVILFLAIAPGLVYLNQRKPEPMPALALVGVFYLIAFALPVFSAQRTYFTMLRPEIVTPASLAAVIAALALFYGGYALGERSLFRAIRPLRLPNEFDDRGLRLLLWLLLIPHCIELWRPELRRIPSVASLLDPAGYVAYGGFYLLWKNRRLPGLEALLVGGVLLPLEMVAHFASGELLPLVMLGLFFMIIYWYANRRLPWKMIVLVCAFFIPFQGVKNEFRQYTWSGRYSSLGVADKARLFAEVAWNAFAHPHLTDEHFYDSAAQRVAHIRLLAFVMQQSPMPVPYWEGETYKPLVSKFIPRFLWPDKPVEIISHTFGRRYSLLADNDDVTAMNLPWLVELWVNFGPLGLALGMPIYGLLFGYLVRKLNRREMTGLEFVVGATLLFPLCTDQESHFSVVAGNIFLLYWCFWGYFHLGYLMLRPKARPAVEALPEPLTLAEDSPLPFSFRMPSPARPRTVGGSGYTRPGAFPGGPPL